MLNGDLIFLIVYSSVFRDEGWVRFRAYSKKRSRLSWLPSRFMLSNVCVVTVIVLNQSFEYDVWSMNSRFSWSKVNPSERWCYVPVVYFICSTSLRPAVPFATMWD